MADCRAPVGSGELVSMTDGQGDMEPSQIFTTGSKARRRSDCPELPGRGEHIRPRFGSVAVRTGGKLIKVDTGFHAPVGTLPDEMRSNGVDRDAVDLVTLTHLHPDQMGWNPTDGRPTFPSARYLVSRKDYENWTSPEALENAQHVNDQLPPPEDLNIPDLMDDDYEITDELTTVATPGRVSIAVVRGRERAFILGDVAPSPAQAHYTEWGPSFDTDGDISTHIRHRILDRLETEGTQVSAGHSPTRAWDASSRAAGAESGRASEFISGTLVAGKDSR